MKFREKFPYFKQPWHFGYPRQVSTRAISWISYPGYRILVPMWFNIVILFFTRISSGALSTLVSAGTHRISDSFGTDGYHVRARKTIWVPGTGKIENLGYRWVPRTGQISIHADLDQRTRDSIMIFFFAVCRNFSKMLISLWK